MKLIKTFQRFLGSPSTTIQTQVLPILGHHAEPVHLGVRVRPLLHSRSDSPPGEPAIVRRAGTGFAGRALCCIDADFCDRITRWNSDSSRRDLHNTRASKYTPFYRSHTSFFGIILSPIVGRHVVDILQHFSRHFLTTSYRTLPDFAETFTQHLQNMVAAVCDWLEIREYCFRWLTTASCRSPSCQLYRAR